jgi:hypothetical protein
MTRFSDPRWLRALIDSEVGESVGIRWFTPSERSDLPRISPSRMPPGNRRLTDEQRNAMDEGWDGMLRVGDGPPTYFDDKHCLSMELWVNTTQPDNLWVAHAGQPTFLWFSAGRDAASLTTALRPYLPIDLARPLAPRSVKQQQADLAMAAKGPIPGAAPGQDCSVRLLVGLELAHINNEMPLDFDLSLLRTGVVDPRFLMQGSLSNNFNPAVTVVRTLYSRSTVRLDWYENLDGVVCAEIYYTPATQHNTIQSLNERFRLYYPLDVPVDVPALLLGLEAISAPALLEHMTQRVKDPNLLVSYLKCLAILTAPVIAEPLLAFTTHSSPVVRKAVIDLAIQKAPELLVDMQQGETDPELQAQINEALGTDAPPRPKAAAKQAPVKEKTATAKNTLLDAMSTGLGRSASEPATDAVVLLNPNPRADQAAIIADIAATFPSAPAVTVTQPPKAWGPFFHFGEVTVRTFIMPMPMPPEKLEPRYGSSWLWPMAKDDLRNHAAMLTLSADGGESPVDRMIPLTMLAAAFIGTCPQAAGVLWGSGEHLIEGRVFREFATRSLPEQLPVPLWIGCAVWSNPDGTTCGHTVGLEQFDLPEIETIDSPQSVTRLRKRLIKLANRLVTTRPRIRDGTIIGQSPTETVIVSYGESRFGLSDRVMRLHHQSVPPAPTDPE